MTLRNATLGLVAIFVLSVWSACRHDGKSASAQGADPVYAADQAGTGTGGNHDEAARRFRANQSMQWRQIAIGSHSN